MAKASKSKQKQANASKSKQKQAKGSRRKQKEANASKRPCGKAWRNGLAPGLGEEAWQTGFPKRLGGKGLSERPFGEALRRGLAE